jgi:hypothetical protein
MPYNEAATDDTYQNAAQAALDWFLPYNRNDVEATAALRDWLETGASTCSSIEGLGSWARRQLPAATVSSATRSGAIPCH